MSPRPPPKISFKGNWMFDLDSDVAESSKDSQRIQPKPKIHLSSTEEIEKRTEFDHDTLVKRNKMNFRPNKYGETRVWTRIHKTLRVDTWTCCRRSNRHGETPIGGSKRGGRNWFQSTRTVTCSCERSRTSQSSRACSGSKSMFIEKHFMPTCSSITPTTHSAKFEGDARPKNKKSTIWSGMRGRDAARKSTPKVNIWLVLTIDFSEIQLILNHNSHSDGQNKSAKNGINLNKKTIHIISLHREKNRYQGQWYLSLNKAGKNGPVKLRYDFRAAVFMKNRLHHESGEQVEEPIHPDQYRLWHLSSSTSWWDKSEWKWKWAHKTFSLIRILFCYSWFRLQSIAIHCDRRRV